MPTNEKLFCPKCKNVMRDIMFYGTNNLEKYPTGKLDICKQCACMHVDNWDPDTYLWILEECDVPYVPDEWNKLMANYANSQTPISSTAIVGRYLAKMRLKKWKDYRWKDNEFLQQLADSQIEQTMKRQGYSKEDIETVIQQGKIPTPDKGSIIIKDPVLPQHDIPSIGPAQVEYEDYFAEQAGEEPDVDLTEEDRTYLRLKWGKAYKPTEWVQLEQLYEEMMQSYDIQGAGHIDTLKLVCKTSLKANQLIDMGDKLNKMFP